MWLSRSRKWKLSALVPAVFSLLLWGCSERFAGWSPLYLSADGSAAHLESFQGVLPQIATEPIANREGQLMRWHLQQRLQGGGIGLDPLMLLHVRLRWSLEARGQEFSLATQNTITILDVEYWLSLADDPDQRLDWSVSHERLHRSTFFNFDDFAELSAQRNVRRQMVEEAARLVTGRILQFNYAFPEYFAPSEALDSL